MDHKDLIFSQFFIKEWRVFCTVLPPWEINCNCWRSIVFNSFNKSICLFKCWIMAFFFSISLSTKGVLPLQLSNSLIMGPISLLSSSVNLENASDLLLNSLILFCLSRICSSKFLDFSFSKSKRSLSYFFSSIRLEQSCSRLLNRSTNKS